MKGSENMQEAEIEMVGFDDAGHLDDDVQEKMHRFV